MDTTIQEIGMVNEIHLCNSCCNEIHICDGDNIIFGTGKGNDNVCACSTYEPYITKESATRLKVK